MVNNQPVTYRHFGGDKLRTAKKQFGGVVKAGLISRYPPQGLHLTFYTPGIKLVTGHFAYVLFTYVLVILLMCVSSFS